MKRISKLLCLFLTALLLSGCAMQAVDDLYCLPKRSEDYHNLQEALDRVMSGLEFCAPLSGENLQTIQMKDLDGDGISEYLLFAKGNTEKPLHILIFRQEKGEYILSDTIQSSGAAFDLVEYARMDDRPGYELIVGNQVSNQVTRSVAVYTFNEGKASALMQANYTKFVTCDLNADGRNGLLVLHPGESAEDHGIAEVYTYQNGVMERSNQTSMSESADRMKRIISGKLHGGQPAVYVASAVGESAIITDVFALVDGQFANVSFSNESGTSVQTLRNYYVYADDIDDDGTIELPDLINMQIPAGNNEATMQYLIRWYAMTASGDEVVKQYTYHNFQSGWYLHLDDEYARRIAVIQLGNTYEFYLWDAQFLKAEKLMTIYALSGKDRDEQARINNRFIVYKGDSIIYAANLEVASASLGITRDSMIKNFHLIHLDWKTGET